MSGIQGGPKPGCAYDPRELCRRIVVCFSTSELRQLAESLGAGNAASWERGTNEAARDLVRYFERKWELETLMAKLREERPLVEWPEPAAPSAGAPESASTTEPPSKNGSEPRTGATASGADVLAQGALSTPAAVLAEASMSSGAPSAGPASGAPTSSTTITTTPQHPAAWPGTVGGAREPPARGVDPKLLVIVSGLTLLAAVIAFLAGRAASPPSATATTTTATGTVTATTDDGRSTDQALGASTDDPAARLMSAIDRSLANVARACEIPVRGTPREDILLRAFDQCGPLQAPARPIADPLPHPPDAIASKPLEDDNAAPKQTGRQAAPRSEAAPAGNVPGSECMQGCESEHRSCKGRCGQEPTQSTLYAEYQGCLSRCLSAASKCRLGCR